MVKPGNVVGIAGDIDMTGGIAARVPGYHVLTHVALYASPESGVLTCCGCWMGGEIAREANDAPTCVECVCSVRR